MSWSSTNAKEKSITYTLTSNYVKLTMPSLLWLHCCLTYFISWHNFNIFGEDERQLRKSPFFIHDIWKAILSWWKWKYNLLSILSGVMHVALIHTIYNIAQKAQYSGACQAQWSDQFLALTSLAHQNFWWEEPNPTFLSVSLDSRAHSMVVLFQWQTGVGSSPTIDRIDFYIIESGYCAKKV